MEFHLHRLLLPLGLALALAGCDTLTSKPPVAPTADLQYQAERALAKGEPARAAELLRQAAEAAPADRSPLLLRAAELYLQAGEPAQAADLLAQVTPAALTPAQRYQRDLLQARILLKEGQNKAAAELLQQLGTPPAELRGKLLLAQAETLSAAGQPLAAARVRAELAPLLQDPHAQAANDQALWALLNRTPLEQLRALMPPPPDTFGGWLELAFLTRAQRSEGGNLAQLIQQWQERYPGHPGADAMSVQGPTKAPPPQHYRQVALLLPLSGPLATPGRAVLDGFMAAYQRASGHKPEVRVIDTGSVPGDVLAAYDQAVREGADFVVGPLSKEALAVLASRSPLPVPTLALNTLPGNQSAPEGLYQFALSPEDEAIAAADYALERGYRQALVLVSVGEWGSRVGQAFADAFSQGGGTVLEVAEYEPGASDFSATLQPLLNLDASEQRFRRLRSITRRSMKFEPYRRGDVDVIFMGAFPREARLIQPQLRFFHAMDVPLLATSHAYGGHFEPANLDLEGVQFVDMPWLLAPQTGSALSRDALQKAYTAADSVPRLFAFGLDAYRLVSQVQGMAQTMTGSLDGATGVLTLDAQGQVRRQLLAARFKDNQVVPVEDAGRAFGFPARP